MSDIAIRVEHLSKQYRIGERESYKALRDVIADGVASPFRRMRSVLDRRLKTGDGRNSSNGHRSSVVGQPSADSSDSSLETRNSKLETPNSIWALDDVSFEVKRGEVVGIIGRNGAGKSTLLKILSRITKPTKGHAKIFGRVGSLLEVGTGFHPELTGRENIYLNGAILGMRKAEIERKFDEIVAFAEVEKFIDTPVKRYSSGMYVRLAFAVAAHMDNDILIVDEVLAVGDAEFQKKCLGKMGEVAHGGRTVLFVSHNLQSISNLTTECILLRDGAVVIQDKPQTVIAKYLQQGITRDQMFSAEPLPDRPSVTRVEVNTSRPNSTQVNGQPLTITFDITTPRPLRAAAFSFQLVDSLMQPVVHLGVFESSTLCRTAGTYRLSCTIPNLRLYLGQYTVTTHLAEAEGGVHFETLEGLCPFEVVMFGKNQGWSWQEGVCRYLEEGKWTVSEPVQNVSYQPTSKTTYS